MRRFNTSGLVLLSLISGQAGPPSKQPQSPSLSPTRVPLQALNPELANALRFVSSGEFDKARALAGAYLQMNPDSGQAEFLLGLTYHRQRMYSRARPHFERALQLEPAFHQTNHFLGYCLYYLGDAVAARRAFEQALRNMPDEGGNHFGLGLLDFDEDHLDQAAGHFTKAVELHARRPGRAKEEAAAHVRLADVHIRQEQFDPARVELQTAVRLNRDLYGAYFKLHRVFLRLGDDEAARQAKRRYDLARNRVRPREGFPE